MSERESRAADLVSEYLDNFDEWVSDEYEAKARSFAAKAELDEPINRAPSSIAAGAIYAAGLLVNEKRTQAEVAAACDVSKPTIRNTYQEVIEAEGYEVEPRSESGPSHTGLARMKRAAKRLFQRGEGDE
jgi:transcription initiation factor TFIIIB Brf1 subunit/transcription initiation factor TFIIB